MFRDESWKPIHYGVKGQGHESQKQCRRGCCHSCGIWLLILVIVALNSIGFVTVLLFCSVELISFLFLFQFFFCCVNLNSSHSFKCLIFVQVPVHVSLQQNFYLNFKHKFMYVCKSANYVECIM